MPEYFLKAGWFVAGTVRQPPLARKTRSLLCGAGMACRRLLRSRVSRMSSCFDAGFFD